MKKLIILSLMFATIVIVAPQAEAREAAASVTEASQIVVQPRGRRWNRNRRTRVVTSTRVRWIGRYRYRETIRTTYFANGRTRTVVIRRVRLGGRRPWRNY